MSGTRAVDLSHASYLHPHFAMSGVSPDEAIAATKRRLEHTERSIIAYRWRNGLPPNQVTHRLCGFPADPVNSRAHMTWHPPALLDFDVSSCAPEASEREGLSLPQAHCITPETEITCHSFSAAARNRRLEDADVDESMVEAVQARMGATSDLESLHPLLLSSDGPQVAARRRLSQLIAEENAV